MDETTLRRATKLFFTTKELGKGTGLLAFLWCSGRAEQSRRTLYHRKQARQW